MAQDDYRNLPFAPWAGDVPIERELVRKLTVIHQAIQDCCDRPPTEEELATIDALALRDGQLAAFCRQLLQAFACPYQEQRFTEAVAIYRKIVRHLGR